MNKKEIYTLCYCENFDFESLQKHLQSNLRCTAYRKVLNVEWKQGDAFILDYGVVVFWNIDASDRIALLQKLEPYSIKPLSPVIEDEFSFSTTSDSLMIKNDHMLLTDDDVLTRLAISQGIAQSTKLMQFEFQVQETINDTAYIPQNIAETGTSKLSRSELAKLRGRLFMTKSNIMLHYDLLDVPDFFWEYPELHHIYIKISEYLEVKQRIEVLSKKLETIHELFEMMADELKHQHSSLLEWIIIWLIAFEIFVTLFHDIFKIF